MKHGKSSAKTGPAQRRGAADEAAMPPAAAAPTPSPAAARAPSPAAAPASSPAPASAPGLAPAPSDIPAQPAAPILLQVDADLSGGFIHGRFDVQIRGRVASPVTIEDVEIETGGVVIARAAFGQPHRAPVMTLPDGTSFRHRAFQLTLPRPEAQADAPCICILRAHTADGQVHTEQLDIAIDPTAPQPVMVRSGPTQVGLAASGRPQIVLYVERAVLDSDGNLGVHGWAVAMTPIVTVQVFAGDDERLPAAQLGGQRDDVANFYSTYPNARLSGFAMNGQLDQSVRALRSIKVQAISMHGFAIDLVVPVERIAARAAARPLALPAEPTPATLAEPQHGFSPLRQQANYQLTADFRIATDPLPLAAVPAPLVPSLPMQVAPTAPSLSAAPLSAGPLPAGPLSAAPLSTVVLPAAAPAGAEPPAAPPADKRREIHCYIDEAAIGPDGTLLVEGWAVCAVGIAGVGICLGREKVGDAELGLPRPDVGEEFAAIPMARLAGFRFRRAFADLADGEHAVRLVVANGLDDGREETKVVTFKRTAPPPPPDPEPAAPPAPAAAEMPEFRFELDAPQVVNDTVPEPITGRLTIEGWCLARSGVTNMEVFLDDQRLGEAHYGLARQDVGAAFPEWQNSLRSGYAFHCPPRSLRDGSHTVRLVVRAKNGQEMTRLFTIEVKKSEDEDGLANIRRRMMRAEAKVLADVLDDLHYHPHFHLVLRAPGIPDPAPLRLTLESLLRQACADWHLTLLTDSAEGVAVLQAVAAERAADHAGRVAVLGPDDAGFDTAFDAASAVAGSDAAAALFGLLCPGDELAVDALAELALASGLHGRPDFLYADEARVSPASHEREPFFKPDFSPDLLLSTNYIGRPWVVRGPLLHRVGATPRSLLRDGEYDLVLRCTELSGAVHHLAKLLAQRGPEALDDGETGRAALLQAAARRGVAAEVGDGCLPGTWRFRRTAKATGKVAIIIPTCAAHGYIETCIATLRARTAYRDYEIVCIDNIPESQMAWKVWLQQNADRIVDIPEAFNWSRFNNLAAAAVPDADYLLFLNDDIEITQDDWLDVLLEHAQRPEIGIVGPQLLYPSGKVQHAGMFLGAGIGRHSFRFAAADEPGYFGLALTQRNVIAVTGACMLMRRDLFDQLGGFDEAHSVINNDLDFCLRTHTAGKLTVFTPHVSLIHHELASRERLPDVFDTGHFNSRWKTLFAAGDPYFSPLLSRFSDDYRPDDEAVQTVFAAHPLFETHEIRSILVVKLDHIGDFVTGLPAIRRLKALFPHARLTVLAGRHARGFASMEPAIDELMEFDFFHARSQLGERDVTKDEFLDLRERLAPYRFDLAVDLRKHLSTRDVLQFTGARFLAGYDYMGQFPFLDIALEWEGDKTLQRKRSHIVDDLLALVGAIATACGTDRALLPILPQPDVESLPEAVRPLFARPVVAMHIGAGNVTKTWPAEYFSALIDLLTERNGVNVILIGGPDERAPSEALRETLLRPDNVASVAGQTALSDLPRLLSACCLYIGNDSGPKHIAAALGVATIGIHSGVVDAIEWGPVGRRAVALRRNMTCSPCYLARAEDCPRALSCLRHLEPSVVHQTATLLLGHATPLLGATVAAADAAATGAAEQVLAAASPQAADAARDHATAPPDAAAPAVVPLDAVAAAAPAARGNGSAATASGRDADAPAAPRPAARGDDAAAPPRANPRGKPKPRGQRQRVPA